MSFTPKSWVDGSAGGTPITAAELNRMEAGISAATDELANTQSATAYTLTAADAAKTIEATSASSTTIVVPTNATTALPVGSRIHLRQYGAGTVVVSPAVGVTIKSLNGAIALSGRYAEATLVKRATNEWVLSGDLAGTAKRLIKHGKDLLFSHEISSRASAIETDGFFDGYMLRPHTGSTDMSFRVMNSTAAIEADFLTAAKTLPATFGLRHNFALPIVTTNWDWSNESHWTNITNNFRFLARGLKIAADEGRPWKGIWFDNEVYGGGAPYQWNYGSETGGQYWTSDGVNGATGTVGLTAAAARDLAYNRGLAIGQAVVTEWPDIEFQIMYGPYAGESTSFGAGKILQNNVAHVNELMGTFGLGICNGMTASSSAKFYDAHEDYAPRTLIEFQGSHNWSKTGLGASSSFMFASQAQKDLYSGKIRVGQGVYDGDILTGGFPLQSAANIQNQLTYALQTCDEYAWLYTESHDWNTSPYDASLPVPPQAYKDAVKAARLANGLG